MAAANALIVKFSNGKSFSIPAEFIAGNRTAHYADRDGFERGTEEWDDEFASSLDEYEIEDWALNNMNWEDLKEMATALPDEDFDYDAGWGNCHTEIYK